MEIDYSRVVRDAKSFSSTVNAKASSYNDISALLNQFKVFIKQNSIKSNMSASIYTNCLLKLAKVWHKDYAMMTLVLSCLGHLVRQMSCYQESSFSAVYSNILDVLVPELPLRNDTKSQKHGTILHQLRHKIVMDLWFAVPTRLEAWLRDFLLEITVSNGILRRVDEVYEVLAVLLEVCENNPRTSLTGFHVSLIKLYSFFSGASGPHTIGNKVRNASGELLRFSVQQGFSNRENLITVATGCNVSEDSLADILSPSGNAGTKLERVKHSANELIQLPKHSKNANANEKKHISNITDNNDDDNAVAELDKLLSSLSSYKVDQLNAFEFTSFATVKSNFAQLSKDFEGRETEANWSKREKHVNRLRSMLRCSMLQNSIESQKEFIGLIKEFNLFFGVNKAVNSLRTTLSTNGCKFTKEIFQIFDIHSFDTGTIEYLFKNTIKLCASTKKINTNNANVTMFAMLNKIYDLKVFNFRVLNMIYEYANDKTLSPRIFSASWLAIIILKRHHDLSSLTDSNNFNTSGVNNALKITSRIIAKNLGDPSPLVREPSRQTFWLLFKYYPDEGQALYDGFTISITKLLDKTKPKDLTIFKQSVELPSRAQSAMSSRHPPVSRTNKYSSYSNLLGDQTTALAKIRSVSDSAKPGSINSGIGKPMRLNRKLEPGKFRSVSAMSSRYGSFSSITKNEDSAEVPSETDTLEEEIHEGIASKLIIKDDNPEVEAPKKFSIDAEKIVVEDKEEATNPETTTDVTTSMTLTSKVSVVDKIAHKLASSAKEENSQGVEMLITLIAKQNYKVSLKEYDVLVSKIRFLLSKNPQSLYPLVDESLMVMFIDLIQVDDYIKLVCLRQYDVQIFRKLAELSTFESIFNNLVKIMNENGDFTLTCLDFITDLVKDQQFTKSCSNLQALIDKLLLNSVLIWQNQQVADMSKVASLLKIISDNYIKEFKYFLEDNFEKDGSSKNVLISKSSQEIDQFMNPDSQMVPIVVESDGKQDNYDNEVMMKEDESDRIVQRYAERGEIGRTNVNETLGEGFDEAQASHELARENYQESAFKTDVNEDIELGDVSDVDFNVNARETKLNSPSVTPAKPSDEGFKFSPLKDSDYGLSPIKISDLNMNFDDDIESGSSSPKSYIHIKQTRTLSNDLTQIIPNFKESDLESEAQAKKAAKIKEIIEKVDPLKSINKVTPKIKIYSDRENSFDNIYGKLMEAHIMKYRLMSFKQSGVEGRKFYSSLNAYEASGRIKVVDVKKILDRLAGGSLKLKDSSVLISVLNRLVALERNKEYHEHDEIRKWVVSNKGYDEIFNSLLFHINTKGNDIVDNHLMEYLIITRLMIVLSNETGGNTLFSLNKLKKYWIISEEILDKLGQKISEFEDGLMVIMEVILKEISSGYGAELVEEILKSWKNRNHFTKTRVRYYLHGILEVLSHDDNFSMDIISGVEEFVIRQVECDDTEIRRASIMVYSMLLRFQGNGNLKLYQRMIGKDRRLVDYYGGINSDN